MRWCYWGCSLLLCAGCLPQTVVPTVPTINRSSTNTPAPATSVTPSNNRQSPNTTIDSENSRTQRANAPQVMMVC